MVIRALAFESDTRKRTRDGTWPSRQWFVDHPCQFWRKKCLGLQKKKNL